MASSLCMRENGIQNLDTLSTEVTKPVTKNSTASPFVLLSCYVGAALYVSYCQSLHMVFKVDFRATKNITIMHLPISKARRLEENKGSCDLDANGYGNDDAGRQPLYVVLASTSVYFRNILL